MAPPSDSDCGKARPRISAQGTKFATILVGPEKADFTLQEELLTYYSSYFRAALTGSFKEGKEKTVTLEAEDPQIFEFFVHWLFYKRFPNDTDCSGLTDKWATEGNKDAGRTELGNMIHLYVFCDKYQALRLKANLLDRIFDHLSTAHNKLAEAELVSYTFNNLPNKDPLRRMLADAFVYWADECCWAEEDIFIYPPKFLEMVMSLFIRRLDEICSDCTMEALCICNYHNHETEEEKKACSAREGTKQ